MNRENHELTPGQRKSCLYMLPVPLSDTAPDRVLPQYNIEVIRRLRHFIVEDVRSARRFLKRCDRNIDIDSLTFSVLNEHSRPGDVDMMLTPLDQGYDMGVISEAGCPGVADPGADAVDAARRRGFTIIPLIGPSSILLSLMASGFNGQTFAFAGYLPVDDSARTVRLREMERRILRERQTQIFIETPYRNNRLIEALVHQLPASMRLCVACDLTGQDESITVRSLGEWGRVDYDYAKKPAIFLLYS